MPGGGGSSGTQTATTVVEPWGPAQPHITGAMDNALDVYNYYGGNKESEADIRKRLEGQFTTQVMAPGAANNVVRINGKNIDLDQIADKQGREYSLGITPQEWQDAMLLRNYMTENNSTLEQANQNFNNIFDIVSSKAATPEGRTIDTEGLNAAVAEALAAQNEKKGFFPGQTYVDFSPETEEALSLITQRARDGSDLQRAANSTATATARGDFLNSNPYLDEVINNTVSDLTDKYLNSVVPSVNSTFASSGRYGSGLHQSSFNDANQALASQIGDTVSGIRYGNYNDERTRQMQALGLAPSLSQADYMDYDRLLGVGEARQSLDTARLQDEMDRFYFYENQPSRELDAYINRINALSNGYSTTTQTMQMPQAKSNTGLNALSGLASIAGIATGLGPLIGIGAGALGAGGGALGLGSLGGLGATGSHSLSGLAGMMGSAVSDRSAKENIIPDGVENGHKMYVFNYKNDKKKYRGVMAQDIEKTHPDAISRTDDGLMMVDYSKLSVNMTEVR